MQDSTTISVATPSRWSVVASVVAGWLVIGLSYAAGFLFPMLCEWPLTGLAAIIAMGAIAGWIAPRGHQLLTLGALAAGIGALTLIRGSGWFYYSLIFIPLALGLSCGVLTVGYAGGLFLRRFRVSRCAMLAVLSCVILAEVTALLARDGYLLIRYAQPRQIAFNDAEPSWFFFSPGERALGLTYVALQRKPTDPVGARRIFQKALCAARQITDDNHSILFLVAEGQVKAGFFEDAVVTIRHIRDRFQFELHLGIIASEMARQGGQSQAKGLFNLAIQQAQQRKEQRERDRDLYLIGYRQWEGGMLNEARQTAELIQATDSKADLLDRLNDSTQLEIARQQADLKRFDDAAATIREHVKDPYRYCDSLVNIATRAATNAEPDQARRVLGDALQSAQKLESPSGRNGVIAEIALRQFELGFKADGQQTLALIDHPGIKDELLKNLSRTQ